MPTLDLTALAQLLAADRAHRRGTGPTWAALSERSTRELHRTVRWLERSRPGTYGLFGSEDELRVAIVDAFESERTTLLDLDALATSLIADAGQDWLVASPLINVLPPSEPETLAPGAVFIATADGERRDLTEMRRTLRRLFGTDVDPGRRRRHDPGDQLIDTRHTASLVTTETGTRRAAENRAFCKAQYMLAVWTLLEPPHDDMYTPLWPVATTWVPQPSMHVEVVARSRDPQQRETRGATVLYAPDEDALYRPPTGGARTAPFRALAAAERRPATALLSAAWSLYLAARLPTDLQWLDRLELTMRAREALSEPPAGVPGTNDAFERWQAVAHALGVTRELRRRGFDLTDISSVTSRAWQLRNIGAHSAEAALLTLGYPPARSRLVRNGTAIPGSELTPLHIRETVEPTFAAVTFVAQQLWTRMVAADFDEQAWEAPFTPSPAPQP